MAGSNRRNSRKQRKVRARSYHPAVVVRTQHAHHLQTLNDEQPPGEIRLDPTLTRSALPFGQYLNAAATFVSGTALAVFEFFKR